MSTNFFSNAWLVIQKARKNFIKNDPIILAGGLAFFTIFASPPILITIIYLAGLITGEEMANREIFAIIHSSLGPAAADLIQNIINNYFIEEMNVYEQIFTVVIFVFAASTYFIIIQKSLNRIWEVKSKPDNNLKKILKDRLISIILIFLMGVIFLLSLFLESSLAYLSNNIQEFIPGYSIISTNIAGFLVSIIAVMIIMAMIYKFLPDVIIEWKVVWVGAAVTAFLFTIGKFIITFGLTSSNIQNMYGAAGSTAIFLLWVFYSSLILFFGAEITQQYARSFAETIRPKDHAVKIVTHEADKDYIAEEQNS